MLLGRLISLLLSTALVACPTVCRSGHCAQCPQEQTKTAACPHCPASQTATTADSKERSDEQPPIPAPIEPHNPCGFGNCLCAGAVTNHGGLDAQIDHVLGVFAAVDALGETARPALVPPAGSIVAIDHCDPPASGRCLRLRIESLLI